MQQTTSLLGEANNTVQVIALDSRKSEQVTSDKQYLKILQLTDLLSRHLELKDIVEVFSNEINSLIPHDSYRYVCDQLDEPVTKGKLERHSLNYHLTIQQMDLGELTFHRDQPFSANEVCQFEDLLCALVYPIKNALMYHAAIASAYRDPLTGINNRAAMEKWLPRELRLAQRHQHDLVMMVMDMDGFKQINDSFGHDVGDMVLKAVAQVVKSRLRDTDMLFRFAGDEFVCALPHTDEKGAIDVAQRILKGVGQLELEDCSPDGRLGMSIGLSLLRTNDDFSLLFKRVDQAMYQAKKAGKHRFVVA